MRRGALTTLAVLATILGVWWAPALAQANVSLFQVNVTRDASLKDDPEACTDEETAASKECPLRAALEFAESLDNVAADSIEVRAPVGTYVLTKGALPFGDAKKACTNQTVKCPVAIVGAGAAATKIESKSLSQLILEKADAGPVEVRGLALEHGLAENGGAIGTQSGGGRFTIRDSVLAENEANVGGGAVDGQLDVLIVDSKFSRNSAAEAGGVSEEHGVLTIRGSTFVGNEGGAAAGGAVSSNLASVHAVDSTFTENQGGMAGAAFEVFNGSLSLAFSTVARNRSMGYAIEGEAAEVSIEGSILSGDGAGECNGVTLATSGVNVLFGPSTCTVAGPAPLGVDPRLAAPVSAGLLTVLPLEPGSPALNAGGADCPSAAFESGEVDGRGVHRPQGPACDIGAFEAASDAALSLSATPSQLTVGATQTVTATVTDTGSDPTGGTVVSIPVPAGTTFVTASPGCSVSFASPVTATCSFGAIAPGQARAAEVTLRAGQPGGLLQTASVATTSVDDNPADDTATIASSVLPAAGTGNGSGSPKGNGSSGAQAKSSVHGKNFGVDSHGNLRVRVSCAAASSGGCQDTLSLYSAKGVLQASAAGPRKAVLFARAHLKIAAGKAGFVTLHLSRTARRKLSAARRALAARLVLSAVSATGAAVTPMVHTTTVTLHKLASRH